MHLLLILETSHIIYLWEDWRIIIICLVWWWHVLMLMLTVATDKRMTITQLKCACLILILWLLRWWNFKASSDGYPSPFSSNWHCLFLLVVCCGEKILPSISFSFFFLPFLPYNDNTTFKCVFKSLSVESASYSLNLKAWGTVHVYLLTC